MHVTFAAGNSGMNSVRYFLLHEGYKNQRPPSSFFQCGSNWIKGDWIYVGATDIYDNKVKDSNYGEVCFLSVMMLCCVVAKILFEVR